MTQISTAMDVIQLLKGIEQRSQQGGMRLSQQDDNEDNWTAINFRLAQLNYLIPLTETREIFPVPKQITSVPRAKAWVYGIANLRGELLPIFDLKCFLLGQTSNVNKRSRVIQHDSAISNYLNGNVSQKEVNWDVFSFHKLAADPRFLNAAK